MVGRTGEGERGSRGAEVRQSLGVRGDGGWGDDTGQAGGVRAGKSELAHKFGCGAACVCALDLEPDGVAAGPEVMRSHQGEMGEDDQWENDLPTPQIQ